MTPEERRVYKLEYAKQRYILDPGRSKAKHDRWFWANRERVRAYRRKQFLRERYGLAVEQVDAMLIAQNGLCALCDQPLVRRFHIDHDHATGVIRGLLHDQCNRGLSLFGDDLERRRRAVSYLEAR